MQAESQGQSRAGMMIIVGGALAIVALFLDWINFEAQGQDAGALKGSDLSAGTASFVIGIVLVILGIVLFVRGSKTGGKGVSIAAIVLSVFVLLFGAYSAFAPEDSLAEFEASDVAEQVGISEDLAKAFLKEGFTSGQLSASTLIGSYIATAAGAIALAGSIMGVSQAKKIRAGLGATGVEPGAVPPQTTTPDATPPTTSPDA